MEESGGGRAKGEVRAELREEGAGRGERRWQSKGGGGDGAQRGGGLAEESGGDRAKGEVGETARGAAARRGAPKGGGDFRDEGAGLQWGGVIGEWSGQGRVVETRLGQMRRHQERLFDNTGVGFYFAAVHWHTGSFHLVLASFCWGCGRTLPAWLPRHLVLERGLLWFLAGGKSVSETTCY